MKLNWETAIVIVAVVAGVFGATFLGKDPQVMLSLAGTILSAVLLSKSQEIKTNVNGNMSALIAEIAASRHTLAEVAKTTVPASSVTTSPVVAAAVPILAAATEAATAAASTAATAAATAAAEGQAAV